MNERRLLLVEDDESLAKLVVWHFERQGFAIDCTANGNEALVLAEQRPPDIIILDWMVEGLCGLEVCRRLRRMSATASVPIVMLTARAAETDRVEGLESGADDFVTKPFSPRELVARVNAVLRRSRPALPEDQLSYADLRMDLVRHRVTRAGRRVALGPTEYNRCVTCSNIRSGYSRAKSCSTASGRRKARSSCGRWTSMSGGFAARSTKTDCPTSSAPSARKAIRSTSSRPEARPPPIRRPGALPARRCAVR